MSRQTQMFNNPITGQPVPVRRSPAQEKSREALYSLLGASGIILSVILLVASTAWYFSLMSGIHEFYSYEAMQDFNAAEGRSIFFLIFSMGFAFGVFMVAEAQHRNR
jgi:predicted membrane protein